MDRVLIDGLQDGQRHAGWLTTEARHRGPAKLGIALLGVCGEVDDIELVKPFAAHRWRLC